MENDIGLIPPPSPGYRIRIMRKEKGLRQEQLADALNGYPDVSISTSMISLYESNKIQPQPATWDAMADFFDVSLDWLRCRSEIRNPDKQLAALNFPEDVLELARKLTAMPNGIRRELCVYVDEMTEAIRSTRARQLERLRKRTASDPDFEQRTRVRITD